MELRNLKVLVEVVRQGSFTRAAQELFSTQSTVSKAIGTLEDECGLPLLHRSARKVTPTAAGDIVLRHARRMLGSRDDLLGELAELKGLKRGTLRLGLPRIGSDALFAPVFARFRAAFPGIDVELREAGSGHLRERLHAGELDLAGLLLPVDREFEAQELACEPVVAMLPASHTLAQTPGITLEQLAHEPLILFDTGFVLHTIIMQAFRARRISPQVAVRTSQLGFMLELVANGVGVAFLPRRIALLHPRPDTALVAVHGPAMEWRMAMAWRREGYLSHAARAWLEIASKALPALSAPH